MTEIQIPEPDVSAPPNSDSLLRRLQPVLTLIIAITAIGLATWEGLENRRHNRLTVQPRLDASIGAGREGSTEYVRMVVESSGLGPAVIKDFRIYLNGVMQDSSQTSSGSPWDNVIKAVSTEGSQINARAFGRGHYFPPGREYVLFEARRPTGSSGGGTSFTGLLDQLAIQVCYCSVYGTNCDEVVLAGKQVKTARCTG